jgi:exopolysaccharide biosynthesis predicted pyruvyltransferase EpsI
LASPTFTNQTLVGSLSQKIHETLTQFIPRGASCALLDFPDHSNVGDSAIWLGERLALRRADARVVYASSGDSDSIEQLTKRLRPGGLILLSGGGNLGDVWPSTQYFRERVISAFPGHQIVQLPQTIFFQETKNLARAKSVFNVHPNLIILVRDWRSLEIARNEFKAQSFLCPDMAFAIGTLKRPVPPAVGTLGLIRTDKESTGAFLKVRAEGVERVDWLEESYTGLAGIIHTGANEICHHPRALRRLSSVMMRSLDALARQRLHRGIRTLCRGRIVITDRLHGHILSLLLGIPHVVLDNNYGKVQTFYESWTKDCMLGYWVDSATEALDRALALLHSFPGQFAHVER